MWSKDGEAQSLAEVADHEDAKAQVRDGEAKRWSTTARELTTIDWKLSTQFGGKDVHDVVLTVTRGTRHERSSPNEDTTTAGFLDVQSDQENTTEAVYEEQEWGSQFIGLKQAVSVEQDDYGPATHGHTADSVRRRSRINRRRWRALIGMSAKLKRPVICTKLPLGFDHQYFSSTDQGNHSRGNDNGSRQDTATGSTTCSPFNNTFKSAFILY